MNPANPPERKSRCQTDKFSYSFNFRLDHVIEANSLVTKLSIYSLYLRSSDRRSSSHRAHDSLHKSSHLIHVLIRVSNKNLLLHICKCLTKFRKEWCFLLLAKSRIWLWRYRVDVRLVLQGYLRKFLISYQFVPWKCRAEGNLQLTSVEYLFQMPF